jgi:uncharacterized membrane protein YhaH (DUF805 family)
MRYLNYQGRVNRIPYIFFSIFLGIIIAVADSYRQYNQEPTNTGLLIVFVVELLGVFLLSFVTVKRFHDLGKPSWYFWLLLIPLVNFYWSVLLLARKGISGSNSYGPDPLEGITPSGLPKRGTLFK